MEFSSKDRLQVSAGTSVLLSWPQQYQEGYALLLVKLILDPRLGWEAASR
jgi:hypothetical protein